MDIVAYCIYVFICSFVGVVCAKSGLDLKDWQFWAILCSVFVAFVCGTFQNK